MENVSNAKYRCTFSYNGTSWLEVGDDGLQLAEVEHEPGWDFFELRGSFASSISIRRSFPIRLVRVYSHWPSSDVLATALHPAGREELQLELPEAAKHLTKWIVAVCPSTLALRGEKTPKVSLWKKTSPRTTPLSAAAAAVQAAQGELEASKLERCAVGALSGYLRQRETSPTSSGGSCGSNTTGGSTVSTAKERWESPRCGTPKNTAIDILTQLYEEEVLTALRSNGRSGDESLDEVTGVRIRNDEIAMLKEELSEERRHRDSAEASKRQAMSEVAQWQERYSTLQQQLGFDVLPLKNPVGVTLEESSRQLRNAERERMSSEMQVRQLSADLQHARRGLEPMEMTTLEDAISALVTMEVKQLHGLSSEDRQLAKRRLLLRWHPDKNAGNGAGNDLAKKVMQGLQVHPEWNQGSVLP
eukprot:symbB.v1.2.036628.t1/scaffold5213.1/size29773/1